jgi:hypothetical protein
MTTENPIRTARSLIDRHGSRALALAHERLEEARLSGDTAALEHWGAVVAAAEDLRRTGRRPTPPVMH